MTVPGAVLQFHDGKGAEVNHGHVFRNARSAAVDGSAASEGVGHTVDVTNAPGLATRGATLVQLAPVIQNFGVDVHMVAAAGVTNNGTRIASNAIKFRISHTP